MAHGVGAELEDAGVLHLLDLRPGQHLEPRLGRRVVPAVVLVHCLVDQEDDALHAELTQERVGDLVIVHVAVVERDEDGFLGQGLHAFLGVAPVGKVDRRVAMIPEVLELPAKVLGRDPELGEFRTRRGVPDLVVHERRDAAFDDGTPPVPAGAGPGGGGESGERGQLGDHRCHFAKFEGDHQLSPGRVASNDAPFRRPSPT